MKPTPGALSLLAIVCAGAVGAGVWLAGMAADCDARWKDSGFQYRYDSKAGCQVLAGSRWIPEARVTVHAKQPISN